MKYIVPLGRLFYALIFIMGGLDHVQMHGIKYAAAQHVPLPSVAVPVAGAIALLGGLSVLVGFKARWGAWLLIIFLLPVTVTMHNFWAAAPASANAQQIMFMKNVSMLGAAFLIAHFGAGPLSLDSWLKCRAKPA